MAKLDSAEGLDVLLDRFGTVEGFVGDLAGALFFDPAFVADAAFVRHGLSEVVQRAA